MFRRLGIRFERFFNANRTPVLLISGFASVLVVYSAPIYHSYKAYTEGITDPDTLYYIKETERRRASIKEKAERLRKEKDPEERKKIEEEINVEHRRRRQLQQKYGL